MGWVVVKMYRVHAVPCVGAVRTLLRDVETVLYGCWSKVGRSRLSSFFEGGALGSRLVESVDYLLSYQSVMYNSG